MHGGLSQGLRRRAVPAGTAGWSAGRSVRQAAWWFLCLLALMPAVAPLPAAAHEIRPAIATLTVASDGSLSLDIVLNLEAAIAEIGPDTADTDDSANVAIYDELRSLEPDQLSDDFARFEHRFLNGVSLTAQDGTPVELTLESLEIPDAPDLSLARQSEVRLVGALPETAEALTWTYAPSFGASVIRLQGPDEEEVSYSEYVAVGASSAPVAIEGVEQSAAQVLANYIRIGFVHVLPLGLDHILFVVGLFLLSPRPSALLWQVSAFTLAHTITLALGATGTVLVSSRLVETLIAASIAYVAVENLFTSRLQPWRPLLVFGFGLLHGLGFAGVLAEIGLPPQHFTVALVSFNIGVELAQLTIIAGCFVVVGWALNRTWYRQAIKIPASLAIAAMALYWMAERSGMLA